MATESVIVAAAPVTAAGTQEHHSYVDWPAVFAGIVLASAISLVLLTFGAALGLSFTNFRGMPNTAPIWAAIAAASWLLWVQVSSMMAGGYLTGRMRRRFHDASEHESDVRDGSHGLIVWAGAMILGAIVAVSGVGAVASAVGNAVGTVTTAASNVASNPQVTGAATNAASNALDPNAYFTDTLFRVPAGTTAPQNAAASAADVRAEAGRILVSEATGTVSADDKTYLAQLVSQQTGMPQDQASARVDQTLKAVDDAKAKAVDAAETARKTAVVAAFLTAAAFLVSAVGAYWAAMKGGRHRDDNSIFADVFGRF